MFITQTLFELKKISKPLITALFVLLLVTLAIPVGHELTQPTYGRSFYIQTDNMLPFTKHSLAPTVAQNSTKTELTKDLIHLTENDIKFIHKNHQLSRSYQIQDDIFELKYLNSIKPLLKSHNYRKINMLTWQLIKAHHAQVRAPLGIFALASGMTSGTHSTYLLYQTQQSAILRYTPNKLAALSSYSDAVNLLLPTMIGWGANDQHSSPIATTLVLLIIAMVILTVIFGRARNGSSDKLLYINSLDNFLVIVAKSFAGLLLFDGMILIGYGLIIVCVTILPGHDFGSLLFPILVHNGGDFIAKPLVLIFGKALIYYTMWFIQLSSFATLISLVTKNKIVIASILIINVFAQMLNLLAPVSSSLAQYFPAHFINLPQFMLGLAPFWSTSNIDFSIIMMAWSVPAWLIVLAIVLLRRYGYLKNNA